MPPNWGQKNPKSIQQVAVFYSKLKWVIDYYYKATLARTRTLLPPRFNARGV